jgi:hypothetical protein
MRSTVYLAVRRRGSEEMISSTPQQHTESEATPYMQHSFGRCWFVLYWMVIGNWFVILREK